MYHINGLEEFGYIPTNRYLYSFYWYMNTVKRVTDLYRCASVNDMKGYVAYFCYIRLKSFDTFIKVIEKHQDYVSANCLLRMLGDNVAIFYLIYGEKNENLRWLRHCLYVLDGCEQNMKVLPTEAINKGCMPDEELEEVNKKVVFNRQHRQRMMEQANEILNSLPFKEQNPKAFQKIVEDRNWKFKEFRSYKKVRDNQYQWRDLYTLIGKTDFFDLLSYLSQFSHGLSMSNLIIDNNNRQNYDGVIAEAVGLLDRMNEYVMDFFVEERNYILQGLLEPKTRDQIITCYANPYRQHVASQWEQGVMARLPNSLLPSQISSTASV